MYEYVKFTELIGKVLIEINLIKRDDRSYENDRIEFKTDDGNVYIMTHQQDCCERVDLIDIIGDLENLKGDIILLANVSKSSENPLYEYEDSFTWTFYNLGTIKDHVTLRWYGSSNGYYSEDADFIRIK